MVIVSEQRVSQKLVLVMALASGLVVANSYYAQPVVETISANLHASTAQIGLIVTASQIGYAIGLAFLVPLGDLVQRRKLLDVMLAGTTLCLVAMALSPNWQVLGVAALLVGVTSVVGQILVPLAATLAAPEERGKVIGDVMTGLLLGILIARVVSGVVTEVAGWRAMFWIAAALMTFTAVLLHRELPTVPSTTKVSYRSLLASVFHLIVEEPLLRLRMIYGALTFASFGVLWTSIGFLLAAPPFGWSDAKIGLFTLLGVAGVVAARIAGTLADRGWAQRQTGAFVLATAISFGVMALGRSNALLLGVGVALSELGIQGTHISNQSLFYALRPDARSRLNTAYMTAYFAAGSIGSALSAVLYSHSGWSGVCVVGAAFPGVGFLVWLAEMGRVQRVGHRTGAGVQLR